MSKLKTLLSVLLLSTAIAACGGGGGGGSSSDTTRNPDPTPTPTPTPTPPDPESSVTVLEVRNDGLTIEVDLVVSDPDGNAIEGLNASDFEVAEVNGRLDSLELTGTPLTVDTDVIPGDFSAVALIDQSDSIRTSDPFDLRLQAVEKLMDLTVPNSEAHIIAFAGTDDQVRGDRDIPEQFYSITDGFATEVDPVKLNQLKEKENSATPLYDALNHGLDESLLGSNVVKAVIVLADGENTILRNVTLADVLQKSADYNVPIYTIGLGDSNVDELINIADSTGGSYVIVDSAEQLTSAMGSLVSILKTKDESIITNNRSHYTLRLVVSDVVGDRVEGAILVKLATGDLLVPFVVIL